MKPNPVGINDFGLWDLSRSSWTGWRTREYGFGRLGDRLSVSVSASKYKYILCLVLHIHPSYGKLAEKNKCMSLEQWWRIISPQQCRSYQMIKTWNKMEEVPQHKLPLRMEKMVWSSGMTTNLCWWCLLRLDKKLKWHVTIPDQMSSMSTAQRWVELMDDGLLWVVTQRNGHCRCSCTLQIWL